LIIFYMRTPVVSLSIGYNTNRLEATFGDRKGQNFSSFGGLVKY